MDADRRSTTGTPRWVKVFALIAVVAVVLFLLLMLVVGGDHGPGRHTTRQRPDVFRVQACPAPNAQQGDTRR